MKKLLMLFVVIGGTSLQAQANTIYFELFGNGLVYSINYDRIVANNISVRAGYGGLSISNLTTNDTGLPLTEDIKITMIPILGNYLMGGGNHKLEIGGGVVMISMDYSGNIADIDFKIGADGAVPTGNIGYRYQKPEGGFFFKASLCPFFGEEMITSIGLGLGYSF